MTVTDGWPSVNRDLTTYCRSVLVGYVRGLSPRRRIVVVAAALLAVALLVALVGPRLVDGLRDEAARVAPDRPGPVLLVPGYGGGTGSLQQLAEALRAGGRTATVLDLPGDGTGDLREQAAALDRAVAGSGADSVDLIGFSAGGVVVRVWVQEYDGPARARRIVTLGSPHHGAGIAAAGSAVPGACPTACQQLVPGSRLLAGLASPVPTPPAWLSVWTADDQTVTPPDSARLPGAVNVELQSVCPDARPGHGGLPTDPTVTRLVREAIGATPLAEPAPGC
jgi:pimeloyl-ACP methyl ester carboxylesterase